MAGAAREAAFLHQVCSPQEHLNSLQHPPCPQPRAGTRDHDPRAPAGGHHNLGQVGRVWVRALSVWEQLITRRGEGRPGCLSSLTPLPLLCPPASVPFPPPRPSEMALLHTSSPLPGDALLRPDKTCPSPPSPWHRDRLPAPILAKRASRSPSWSPRHRPSCWLPVLLLLLLLREALVGRGWGVARPPGLGGWGTASQPAAPPLLGGHAPGCRLRSVGTWQVDRGGAYNLSVPSACPPSCPISSCAGWPRRGLCPLWACLTTQSPLRTPATRTPTPEPPGSPDQQQS